MWLNAICALLGFKAKRIRKDTPHRKRRGFHLEMERLEDRFAPAAAVYTDKLDYLPGQTARITAIGFNTGSVVQFQVVHDPSTPGISGGAGHEPWSVRDGSSADLDRSKNGKVVTRWYVNPDDSLNATFILTATGSVGAEIQTASTTFTDHLGSISWEKRRADTNALQGGATFTVKNNATGTVILTVTDNGPGDVNPTAGQIKVVDIPTGSYTVREIIAPPGFALDDDPTRKVIVSESNLNPVIGRQGYDDPGNTDYSDFHNRLGKISWEKRRGDTLALQGGATFTIRNAVTGALVRTVTDNGPGDADPIAGRITVKNIELGTYIVTEIIAPAGFGLDPHRSRTVKVADDRNGIDDDGDGIIDDAEELNAVIGVQGVINTGATSNEADFIDPPDFSKRNFIL